jgi:hypothetical protein
MLPFTNLTLAARIRWRKKYDRNPLLTIMQDKLAVKKFAAKRGVPSAEVLFVTQNPETIPFDDLPEKCFIKANHGRNWNILKYGGDFYNFVNGKKHVNRDGSYNLELTPKLKLTREQVVQTTGHWLHSTFDFGEWAYYGIPPAIFAERLIEPEPGKETLDYRFYTFSGKVAAINLGSPSMRKSNENIFFDVNWNKFTLRNNFEKEPEKLPQKPAFLSEMIEAAGRLGKEVDFVRIDFFADSRQFYLSEITIYPDGGQDNRPTSDHAFNLFLGRQWKMTFRQWLQAQWLEMRINQ